MQFVNPNRQFTHNNQAPSPNFQLLMFNRNIPQVKPNPQVQQLAIPTQPPAKKIKWGEPTWFLFHTIAEKIRPHDFKAIRVELLNNVYAICTNLPCPDCANHAKQYLDAINFNTIQTKDDLKTLFFNFHNSVNIRKGFPVFPRDQLDAKYSTAITIKIIQNFMVHFADRNRGLKLLASDLHRSRMCVYLKQWFNDNIRFFEL